MILIGKPSYQEKIKRFKEGSWIQKPQSDDLYGQNGFIYKLKDKLTNSGNTNKELDFSRIVTTNNRPYSVDNIKYINSKLSSIEPIQRAVILANIIEESGGDPTVTGPGGFYGLLQWGSDRYSKISKNRQQEMDTQIKYILNTLNNITDRKSWSHGGKGSGYQSAKSAYDTFFSGQLIDDVNHAFTLGYVRPTGKNDSAKNRLKVAQQIYNIIK